MADEEKELDIRKVFEQATNRMSLQDLAQQGFEKVKVLDEDAVQRMVAEAVDRAITTQTAGERDRLLENSRRELDKLLRDHKAAASRARLLEADKNELISRVENLERQLQLKEDLEEETLHKRVEEGLASLQKQVEDLRGRYQGALQDLESSRADAAGLKEKLDDVQGTHDAALAELEDLHKEAARLRQDRDRVEKEAEATLARTGTLEKQLAEEQSRARGAEKARSDLVGQILGLQQKEQSAAEQRDRAAKEAEATVAEAGALERELAGLRQREQSACEDRDRAQKEAGALQKELAGLRQEEQSAAEDRDRARNALEKQLAALRQEGQAATAEAGRLREALAKSQADADGAREAVERERDKSRRAEAAGADILKRLEELAAEAASARKDRDAAAADAERVGEEAEQARQEVTFLKAQLAQQQQDQDDQKQKTIIVTAELQTIEEQQRREKAELERALAEAGRIQDRAAEIDRQLEELRGRAESAREQLVVRTDELEKARRDIAFLRGQLAQREKDREEQSAELQEIEGRQKSERDELERLRAEVMRGAEERVRLEKEVADARAEVQAMQELLGREQEAAREAQNETASLQSRVLDLQERVQAASRDVDVLRVEKAALAERGEVGVRLDRMERLLDSARKSSTAARASAAHTRETAAELDRTLARQQKPKTPRKKGATVQGAAAYDGMALLENFFRKIRLKELFQKHVPVQERQGEAHPSEMVVEVLKALAAGDRPPEREGRAAPLEIVGPSNGPDVERLRLFLGRLSPQAVRSIGQVHHALRLHLYGLPRGNEPLVLDVADLELGLGRKRARRAVRPLLCFDPAREEFWNGHYRANRPPGVSEIPGFLTECLARVPSPFARHRVRLRMDSTYFNEGVIRLLNAKGCGYVIAAPDLRAVRKRARACAFTKLTNGWEVGEFRLRLHPIRKTEGRFVVVRRRVSKKAREEGPALFRDDRHLYHVFATDARGTPWRSFEFYHGRAAALERARALLSDFATSRLRGRSRRAVAALFQASLLASDLMKWFRKSCLPGDERARDAQELRADFLLSPSGNGRSLLVMPRKDRRRKLFARVDRMTRRLRPSRPFKLR